MENPYPYKHIADPEEAAHYQGLSDGWDARYAWEQEPCTEHPAFMPFDHDVQFLNVNDIPFYKHRFNCPECMEKL